MECLHSFRRRHFAGKPGIASRNIGCFLRPQAPWLSMLEFLVFFQVHVFLYAVLKMRKKWKYWRKKWYLAEVLQCGGDFTWNGRAISFSGTIVVTVSVSLWLIFNWKTFFALFYVLKLSRFLFSLRSRLNSRVRPLLKWKVFCNTLTSHAWDCQF